MAVPEGRLNLHLKLTNTLFEARDHGDFGALLRHHQVERVLEVGLDTVFLHRLFG